MIVAIGLCRIEYSNLQGFVNAMIGLGISTVVGAVLGYMFCEQDMELA